MIANNNYFIRNGPVDDADDIPDGRCHVFLLVDQIESDIFRRGSNIIVDSFVSKSSSCPVLVEGSRIGSMPIQSFEKR